MAKDCWRSNSSEQSSTSRWTSLESGLYLLYFQFGLEETVEERSEALHLLRVVVTVDGLQLQPDEGFVGIVRPALVGTQFCK